MKDSFVADLKPGSIIHTTFLVQSRELKKGRSGGCYLDVRLQDSSGTIAGRYWDADGVAFDFDTDDVVLVKAQAEEYQGALQLRLGSIARYGGPSELRDYLPRSSRDSERVYAGLLDRVRRLADGYIRRLLLAVIDDPDIARRYKLAPAATLYHHAYLGGLLDHVSSLVELGDLVCDHYPELNRELVIAGLVLHDLGKLEELQYEAAFRYSTRGQLLGHIFLGLELVRQKIGGIAGFPPALRDQIEHMILAHHGRLEFGSPKEPLFPEALVVHYLDDLDSKLESMRAQYEADGHRPGDWTARNRALGRELFKTRSRAGGATAPQEAPAGAAAEQPEMAPAQGDLPL
ncbi:MAG TPA: HD domain-containing protein [Terriglobia bacterium]|nr:HD domain-containing protein [Terriglobia bacterium]